MGVGWGGEGVLVTPSQSNTEETHHSISFDATVSIVGGSSCHPFMDIPALLPCTPSAASSPELVWSPDSSCAYIAGLLNMLINSPLASS